MPNRRAAARRLVAALRPVIESHLDARGPQNVRATITYLHGETASRKFTAEMHGYDLVISQENTTLSQAVIEYDEHTGLAVGDTLLCVEMQEGEWLAVAVQSDAQPASAATRPELETVEENLTTALAKLAAAEKRLPTLVTTLPASPEEGQEVYLQTAAMLTSAIIWHFRYNGKSSASFKWEFLGGSPLIAGYSGSKAPKVNETEEALTGGPELTVPVEGVYLVGMACRVETIETATRTLMARLRKNGTWVGEAIEVPGSSAFFGGLFGPIINAVTCATGDKFTIGVWQTSAAEALFTTGYLSLIPARV